jgi:hypothetical protein
MKCTNCGEETADFMCSCVVCGYNLGYPNVRAALLNAEVNALKDRVEKVENDINLKKCDSILKDFRDTVAHSSAVINCSLDKINEFASSDNNLYQTFYQAVGSESRLPENNVWDEARNVADSLLFPFYKEHIHFASLSINQRGVTYYGECCMVLKDLSIQERATVFEENSTQFIENNNIRVGGHIPYGYRASWKERELLAVAKLGKRLTSKTNKKEFSEILASSNKKESFDFIEVHIYGPISRRAIKYLSYHESKLTPHRKRKSDKVLFKAISRKLKDIGVNTEIF